MRTVAALAYAGAVTLTAASAAMMGADEYEVVFSTIDSGGGTSTGSGYEVSVTFAQQDAARLSGGTYVLEGGFWPGPEPLIDCNGNSISDDFDITGGGSLDANGNGIPDECELPLEFDVRPGACPNLLNCYGNGIIQTALLGAADMDVLDIDFSTVQLVRADGVGGAVDPFQGGVAPGIDFDDVGTPVNGDPLNCHTLGGDGWTDMTLNFRTQDIVEFFELHDLPIGTAVEVLISGTLYDGTAFGAFDWITLADPCTEPSLVSFAATDERGNVLPQGWLDVTPSDSALDTGGFGDFNRCFPYDTNVVVRAQSEVAGLPFLGWRVDGVMLSADEVADRAIGHRNDPAVLYWPADADEMSIDAVYGYDAPGTGSYR